MMVTQSEGGRRLWRRTRSWRRAGNRQKSRREEPGQRQTRNQEGTRSRKILVGRDPEDIQDRGSQWSQHSVIDRIGGDKTLASIANMLILASIANMILLLLLL